MQDEQEHETLGSWMRRRRKALDLTQAALAHCVGCAEVTIRRLEAGVHRPSRQMAERLARCLEIPADERAVFVQGVRGERRLDRFASPLLTRDAVPRSAAPILPTPLLRDRVPAPALLPSGSRMPLRRNPLFVGRDADLRDLAYVLHAGGTAAIGQVEIAAATGLGGIGKTQLACEFVHRYGQFFAGGVFWLSFADPATIPMEVAACGGDAGMDLRSDFDTLPLEKQVSLVRAVWQQPIARLLVFDNCEDEALLEQWRPAHGGCRVLLTSRRQHWDAALGVQLLPLDVLSRADSLALLRSFRLDLAADADLAAIAETLGDLPLALHLAGSFLAKYRHAITPAQYRERLHTRTILDDRSLQSVGLSPTEHVQHVARTFEQSYARLDPTDPTDALANTLLTHAGCFAPGELLPRWLLLRTLAVPDDDAERALVAEDALTRLIDLGLLETDTAGSLRLHRLLVAFVQATAADEAAQMVVEATMLRVAEDLNKRRNPQPLLTVQPHLRFLTERAQPRATTRAAGLCNALGYHLWQLGVYGEAQHYLEQALAMYQRVLGADHPDTASSLNNLGSVFYAQGQSVKAQRYFEQALAIRQRVLGADHPDTARSFNNLGSMLHMQGQYQEAQDYLEQALAIAQRVLGADHPDTARTLNNLGNVLAAQGHFVDAQDYLQQALAIYQRVLGADHPDTVFALSNLGTVLADQGHFVDAQDYLEQALAIRQRVLGTDHPHTTWSLNDLGLMFKDQGHYVQAQGYLEQAVTIQERVLGTNHPDTALSLSRLGEVLMHQGHYVQAQGYLEQALAILKRVLGPDHPDTARSMLGLGKLLHAQEQVAQARHYLERTVAIFEQRLGPEHPDTEQTRQLLLTLQGARVVGETES